MTHRPDPPRLTYTPAEVAEMLGVQVNVVYRMIRSGSLPAKHLGKRHLRILVSDFERFLESDEWMT